MKVAFKKEFIKNISSIKDKKLADEIEFIVGLCYEVNDITQIPLVKKLTGYKDFYRIRINDYRIGVKYSSHAVTFVCLYHRSVIYKLFP